MENQFAEFVTIGNKVEDIKIKYHVDDIEHIKKIDGGDWIDLRAAEDVTIKLGETKLISLGISMKLPKGYEAHIVPRSSTFKNWGIIETNSMGIIDESYCGEDDIWRFPAMCLKPVDKCSNNSMINPNTSTIHKNDRICQFRIVKKQPQINFEVVEHMTDKNRGGFGSTGVK